MAKNNFLLKLNSNSDELFVNNSIKNKVPLLVILNYNVFKPVCFYNC